MVFLKSLLTKISQSANDHLGKASSARISSYFILGQILTSGLIFLTIDIVNAVIAWKKGEFYTIPTEHIFIFGMVLTHHLFLLGLKKSGESSPFPTLDKKMEADTKKVSTQKSVKEEKDELDNFFGEEDIVDEKPIIMTKKQALNKKFNNIDNPDSE